jgi:hypothetical protein
MTHSNTINPDFGSPAIKEPPSFDSSDSDDTEFHSDDDAEFLPGDLDEPCYYTFKVTSRSAALHFF